MTYAMALLCRGMGSPGAMMNRITLRVKRHPWKEHLPLIPRKR